MKHIKLFIVCFISILFVGCAQIPNLEGEGISRDWKTPFFNDTISADRVEKVTREDGTVVREADNYSHDTSVFGWGRTVKADKARFEVKKDTPTPQPTN